MCGAAVEDAFTDFDEDEIAGDHAGQRDEERDRKRAESESVCQRCGGQCGADATTPSAAMTSGALGWLRKNGIRRVRIAKITRVWVASDSMNQPERNSAAPAWKTHNMTPNVMKSNTELSGPKKIMNRRMNPMSQCEGRRSCSSSTWSVGMASWLES